MPRLTFKATAGEYRLLLGNDDVEAPSYELDGLRQEVLDYSATPVPAAWLDVTSPTGGRRLGQMLREPPATAVLWAALGTAVVVLLVLTRRILRSEPP